MQRAQISRSSCSPSASSRFDGTNKKEKKERKIKNKEKNIYKKKESEKKIKKCRSKS